MLVPLFLMSCTLASASELPGEGINDFAFAFGSQLEKKPEANLVYSPYSISVAMAMLREGAVGVTQQEIDHGMHFDSGPGINAAKFSTLSLRIEEISKTGQVQLQSANSLWPDKHFEIIPAFLKTVQENFLASLLPADFGQHPDQERQRINAWVVKETAGRIQDLLPAGSVNASTAMVLVNAIHFKGAWVTPFTPSATKPQDFTLVNGQTRSVPMMHQETELNYGESESLQYLELPYQGEALSLVVLLPKDRVGGTKLLETLTPEKLNEMLGSLASRRVRVTLPSFKVGDSTDLIPPLEALGIHRAFGAADFSGISRQPSLNVSAAVHQAWIKVDENGTEAAAATGIMMTRMSMMNVPVTEFRADHPFLFLIREKSSGTILFMGRLSDPNAGANN